MTYQNGLEWTDSGPMKIPKKTSMGTETDRNGLQLIPKQTLMGTRKHNLRMFARYNYLFKLFFLHLFFASKIYNKTFNTKIAIG